MAFLGTLAASPCRHKGPAAHSIPAPALICGGGTLCSRGKEAILPCLPVAVAVAVADLRPIFRRRAIAPRRLGGSACRQ